MLVALLAALAAPSPSIAALEQSAALGATATVVRPVAIAAPALDGQHMRITVTNAESVRIEASGATVQQAGGGVAIVQGSAARPVVITITY
jgi:hypothetical protein